MTLLGGAAVAWPVAARAQQGMPMIGFLSSRSPGESASLVSAFRQGLRDTGFIEGQNVSIAFRWAEGRYDRLPALAAEVVELRGLGVFGWRCPAGPRSQDRDVDNSGGVLGGQRPCRRRSRHKSQ